MEEDNTQQDPAQSNDTGTPQQTDQASSSVSKDARMWAMLCHLLAIFTGFVAPLIIWLLKKDEDPFVNNQGKEALNFQLTVLIAMAVSALLTFFCIGFFLMIGVGVANLIFCIMASIKANSGEAYRYPVSIRFIR